MRSLVVLATFLISCGSAARIFQPVGGISTEQVVSGWNGCVDRFRACPGWEPYFRPGDDAWGPIYWLVSATGDACEVSALISDKVHRGDRWPCNWRRARRSR